MPTLMKDSRRSKGIIDNLTIEVGGMVFYKSIALERLDHYIYNLPYMVHEKQLNVMCEDVNFGVILLYQVSITRAFIYFTSSFYIFLTSRSISFAFKPNFFIGLVEFGCWEVEA